MIRTCIVPEQLPESSEDGSGVMKLPLLCMVGTIGTTTHQDGQPFWGITVKYEGGDTQYSMTTNLDIHA